LKKKLDLITYKDEIIHASVKLHEDLINVDYEKKLGELNFDFNQCKVDYQKCKMDYKKCKVELAKKDEKIILLERSIIENKNIIEKHAYKNSKKYIKMCNFDYINFALLFVIFLSFLLY
jgi:hypothetical protein